MSCAAAGGATAFARSSSGYSHGQTTRRGPLDRSVSNLWVILSSACQHGGGGIRTYGWRCIGTPLQKHSSESAIRSFTSSCCWTCWSLRGWLVDSSDRVCWSSLAASRRPRMGGAGRAETVTQLYLTSPSPASGGRGVRHRHRQRAQVVPRPPRARGRPHRCWVRRRSALTVAPCNLIERGVPDGVHPMGHHQGAAVVVAPCSSSRLRTVGCASMEAGARGET